MNMNEQNEYKYTSENIMCIYIYKMKFGIL